MSCFRQQKQDIFLHAAPQRKALRSRLLFDVYVELRERNGDALRVEFTANCFVQSKFGCKIIRARNPKLQEILHAAVLKFAEIDHRLRSLQTLDLRRRTENGVLHFPGIVTVGGG